MKKIFYIVAILLCLGTLTSCSLEKIFNPNKYAEYAGTYNLYYMSGSLNVNMYEYYRITLEADGDCIVESKGKNSSQEYKAVATFTIEDGKIKIFTKNGLAIITEVYDYVDGEIHMLNQNISGYSFSAKFRRDAE